MSEIVSVSGDNQQIVLPETPRCQDGSPIEELILNFVKEKAARSQSQKTAKAGERLMWNANQS